MSSLNDSESSSQTPETVVVDAVSAILLGVVDSLRSWRDSDVQDFLDGKREIIVRATRRQGSRARRSNRDADKVASELRSDLSAMKTREEGYAYLKDLSLGGEQLRRVALALDLPVNRSDNMERLRDRIIEGLIGYRLRSAAIRGSRHE